MTEKRPNIGGQALIEGVFMRAPKGAAAAVRKPDGTIVAKDLSYLVPPVRTGILSKPVFRGAVNLIETLKMGFSALNWSAETVEEKKESGKEKSSTVTKWLANIAAVILAVVLFAWLPLKLAAWIVSMFSASIGGIEQFYIHIIAGTFRIIAFVLYIAAISLMPDIRRVFMYHGAEHQVIHAWENGSDNLAADAEKNSPLHARCGTSFLMYVMVITILCYSIIDSLVFLATGTSPAAHWRVLYHLPLIPLVMGVSYEVLKQADKHLDTSAFARALSRPGLWLQHLTTRPATPDMLEVSETAAKMALGMDLPPEVEIVEEHSE
ncbi:MAG: hypothetical protein B1H09_00090 [Gemmatimonadaceae bacterium 4484_173]|nr:MAG: hypothetical protein B1H09_00090 [Gemmatimonadaceae bacterium 4484_173]RKZ04318.1 MAG: DUF1385 domain-containing protein [Candidatus Fermentibacteria bacterium]